MAVIYPKMVVFGNDSNQYSIMNEIRNYLREITKRLQAGGQTEMSYRTDFQVLLRQLLPKKIAITEEAQGTNNIGRPDFTFETVARRRSAALLSEFGLGQVRKYAPFGLILSALHLILRAKPQHI